MAKQQVTPEMIKKQDERLKNQIRRLKKVEAGSGSPDPFLEFVRKFEPNK